LKLGKFGAFIGCSNYPECRYTRPLAVSDGADEGEDMLAAGPVVLGTCPETGLAVTLRKGPYGPYVQRGEADPEDKKAPKPKRTSLPRGMKPADVTLDVALGLLSLPRDIGVYPETGEMIQAGIGRFGPYIKMAATYVSLKGDDDVLTIGINRAIDLMAAAPKKEPPKELGQHPKKKKPVTVRMGRWGPYVQMGTVRANAPKGTDKDAITLEQAIEWLDAKGGTKGGAARKKAPAKKKTAKKKSATKKTAEKSA
jgi:DNA topoisomerase-1